ncbi:DUF1272 domain-containing protein [Pleionea sediminis]|uniref:DUF1272 domain-containing protein n=1 Tax=Pleionea sediminis TaxID=2569479 RepID=UPI0011864114|nr:DUF1272 domain-containing protein [Pleionea sediminis]
MLKMKPNCESCDCGVRADSSAYICSFECTFCNKCTQSFDAKCPNCSGELVPRPKRAKSLAVNSEDSDSFGNKNGINVKLDNIESKAIVGISARTNNSNELNASKAKLPKLWRDFRNKILDKDVFGSAVYGVYSDYETDANGEYSVLAGVECDQTNENLKHLDVVQIPGGKFLVFEAKGSTPEVLYQTWIKVWEYFSQPKVSYVRTFTTDFDVRKENNQIAIYIAVQ